MAKLTNNRNNEVKRGDVYRDMISDKEVIVKSVNKDGTVSLDDERVVSSMVCFKYIKNEANDLETKKEDFAVTDNEFTYKGEKIVTGTLTVNKVVAAVPNGVIVTAADNRKGGIINLYKYVVEEDLFDEIAHDVSTAEVIYDNAPVLAIKLVSVSEHKIAAKEEDAEPIAVEGVNERIHLFFNGVMVQEISGHFGEVEKTVEKEKDGKTILIMTSNKTLEEACDIDGYTFTYLTDIDENATEVSEVILVRDYDDEEDAERKIIYVKAYDYHHHVADPIKTIGVVHDANDERTSLFIVTECGIIHTLNGRYKRQACGADVVEVATNYPYCVRLEAGRVVNKFYLANDDYEIVCITVTLTEDRGYVTEIDRI